jgi:hypothetical protein
MEMTKKQVEFYTAILVLCIIFAVAITLVDYGIKASILEQSNGLRLRIEEWEQNNGRKSAGTNEVRTNNDPDNNAPIPSDVLVVNPPGMEAGNDTTGHTATASNSRAQRSKSGRSASSRTIQNGDK